MELSNNFCTLTDFISAFQPITFAESKRQCLFRFAIGLCFLFYDNQTRIGIADQGDLASCFWRRQSKSSYSRWLVVQCHLRTWATELEPILQIKRRSWITYTFNRFGATHCISILYQGMVKNRKMVWERPEMQCQGGELLLTPTHECNVIDEKLTSVIGVGPMMSTNSIFTSVDSNSSNECKRFRCCSRWIVAGRHGRVLV